MFGFYFDLIRLDMCKCDFCNIFFLIKKYTLKYSWFSESI